MGYFDDIQFISAAELPGCQARVDRVFPETVSLEYLSGGALTYRIDGGAPVLLDEPAAFWHHPRHRYRYGPAEMEGQWDHHWVLMKGPRALRLVEEGLEPLSATGSLAVREAEAFREEMRALIRLTRRGDPRDQGRRVLLLEGLLERLLRQDRDGTATTPHETRIDALAERLRRHPFPVYDFEAEAARCHLSYSRFRHLFRERIGAAPHAFVLDCRMRQAAAMLHDPAVRVGEVAARCGYDDPARFSKLFRQRIGLSPRAYRRSLPQADSPT